MLWNLTRESKSFGPFRKRFRTAHTIYYWFGVDSRMLITMLIYASCISSLPEFSRHLGPDLVRLTTVAVSYYICALNGVIIGPLLIVPFHPGQGKPTAGFRRPNPQINGQLRPEREWLSQPTAISAQFWIVWTRRLSSTCARSECPDLDHLKRQLHYFVVLVVQWLVGRRTCDWKVAGSTPGWGAIKSTMSTQPSIPAGQVNRVPACLAVVEAGCVHLWRMAGNTMWSHMASDTLQLCHGIRSINSYTVPLPF